MNLLNIMLQAAGPAQNAGIMQMLMIVLMIVVFYFFIIRPQSKRQKQMAKEREALKSGDKVITSGGIHGIIREINKPMGIIIVEVWDGVKLKVDYNSVFAVKDQEAAPKK